MKYLNIFKSPKALWYFKAICLSIVIIANGCSSTMLFAFLGFMIEDFFPDKSREELGYKAGYVAGVYYIGQFFFGALWGYLSDKKGRRPVLIASVAGSILSTMLLGFSPNYYVALASRAIGGITDSTFGVGLAYISDITDESNKARGFSIIALGWGVGSIAGPAIGGFFSQPAEKYSNVFSSDGIFARFPYLLPCIITSIVLIFSLFLLLIFLKESLHQKTNYSSLNKIEEDSNIQPLYANEEDVQLEELAEVNLENFSEPTEPHKIQLRFKIWNFLKENQSAILTIVTYWILSFLYVAIDEVVPLWALTEVSKGGLNFGTNNIGSVLTISAVFLVAFQLTFYTPLTNKIGPTWSLRIGLFIGGISFALFPVLSKLANKSSVLLYAIMTLVSLLKTLGSTMSFTSVNILVNSFASKESTGKLNGIAFAGSGLMKALGPTLSTNILAWSETNGLSFPFDYHFVFAILTLFSIVDILLTIKIKI